jgi:hypothetical protein
MWTVGCLCRETGAVIADGVDEVDGVDKVDVGGAALAAFRCVHSVH